MKRVSLADVAREAGVSTSIVSRVINVSDQLRVKQETRARVLEVAASLGYRPHASARALRVAVAGAVGMLVPDLSSPAYARIVRGAFARAVERGYTVLLAEDHGGSPAERSLVDLVRAGRIDGLMVASANNTTALIDYLRAADVPHVFVNRAVEGSGRNVVLDSGVASDHAVRYLAELGHSRIGHVAGPVGLESSRRRAERFRREAEALDLDHATVVNAEFTEAGGAAATGELLGASDRRTAIYTSSIRQGIGALHAAWSCGLACPADVSVITYDDLPIAEYTVPPLTAIEVPLERLGSAGFDALLDAIAGEVVGDITLPIHPRVVARSSTGSPPIVVRQGSRH